MANISAIKLPNGTTYDLKDNGALQLTGGQVTGPVTFGDSVSIDEATIGDLVVNGNVSFTNNIQANTINGQAINFLEKTTNNGAIGWTTTPDGTALRAQVGTDSNCGFWSITPQGMWLGKNNSSNTGMYTINIANGINFVQDLDTIYVPKNKSGTIALTSDIPTVPSNIVNTITTTAGAHTAITSQKGNVSFKVPTTAAHVGIKFGYTTSGNNRAVLQDSSGNLYVIQKDDDSDTKNTAGSTDSSSKLFLIGATSQAANSQTYSHDTAYVGTDGCLYSGSQKTLVEYYGDGSSATRIEVTPTIDVSNNYARFTIGVSDGTNMMQLGVEGNNVNIFDVAHEKTYFAVYGATSLYDDKVHITNIHTPAYDSDAANKKYVDDKRTQTTATLTTTWSSNQQTVTVSGVTTSNTVVVTPAPASYDAYCEAGIYCSAQASNSLTFKCSTVPTSSLTVNIMILK